MLHSKSVSGWMRLWTCMKSIQGYHSEVKLEQATVFSIITCSFRKFLLCMQFFHDAYGYMNNKNVEPGYLYTLAGEKCSRNSKLLVHFSGLLYWTLMIVNASITFLSSDLKFSDLTNSLVSSAQATRFRNLSAFAMNDVESTSSSSYYSDICLKQEQQMVDEPDLQTCLNVILIDWYLTKLTTSGHGLVNTFASLTV